MNKIIKKEDHLPATECASPWGEIATEHGNQTLLKYVKGEWSVGEEEMPLGTKYVAFIDELACGFIKFKEGEKPEVRLGKLKIGKDKLPKRCDCGDLDKNEWEIGDNGKPVDPWKPIMELPLSPADCIGELVVFSAIGEGGAISAVADLCGVYDRSPRHGLLPIIALRTRSYKHKKYGTVHVPVLKLDSWYRTGPNPSGETESRGETEDPGAGLDDEITF